MKKIITMILLGLFAVSAISGCSKNTKNNVQENGKATSVVETNDNKTAEEKEETTEISEEKAKKLDVKLKAEKIGSVQTSDRTLNYAEGGIYYKNKNNKYGIISLDGKSDTGAKYNYCKQNGKYFDVSSRTISEDATVNDMNSVGVVDGNGNVIIPEAYASISVLNDRFIRVCEVTAKTNSKDDALVYASNSNYVSLGPGANDTLYKGTWYVYDIRTGKKVVGVKGTMPYRVTTYGDYISFYTDDGKEKNVNSAGESLVEGATLLKDGSYVVKEGSVGVVYDTEGNKLFEYEAGDYSISSLSNDDRYFVARKTVDSKYKYFLVDRKGKIVSSEFERTPSVYGNNLCLDGKLYDFKGNVVFEEKMYEWFLDELVTGNVFSIQTEDKKIFLITERGEVLFEDVISDDVKFEGSKFLAKKQNENSYNYYSLKHNNYCIENGISVGPWIVGTKNPGGFYDLMDVISGEKIIESYNDYTYVKSDSGIYYIYAIDRGVTDIYVIKAY